MANVQARARGIGELDQGIELGLFMRFFRGEGVGVLPVLLPLFFHGVRGIGGYVLHLRRSFFQNRSPPSTKRRKALPFAVPLFFGLSARSAPANGGCRAALAATLRDEFGPARRRLAPSGGSLGARKKPTASHLRYGEIIDHLPRRCQAKSVKYARGERRFRTSALFAGIPPRGAGREYRPRRFSGGTFSGGAGGASLPRRKCSACVAGAICKIRAARALPVGP